MRWRLVVVPAVVVLGAAAAGVGVALTRDEPSAVRTCRAQEAAAEADGGMSERRVRSDRAEAHDAGASVVQVADVPREMIWQYHSALVAAPHNLRLGVDGVYTSGSVDERRAQWSQSGASPEFRDRRVVVGHDAWNDVSSEPGWSHCQTTSYLTALAGKELDYCWGPREKIGGGGRELCPVFIGAGSKVVVRDPQPGVIDGEPVTTYEVVDFAPENTDYSYLRVRMTLDAQNRLRGGTVFDRDTGQVYLTLTAGPAPGHPPIVDPSAEPLFTAEPPLPPPDLGTVPPGL
jgi:hypothetical protein